MVSETEWLDIPFDEQAGLIAQDAARFFASGSAIDPHDALAMIAPPPTKNTEGPAVAIARPSQLRPLQLINAVYRRVVVDGPAFQVQRDHRGELSVPFIRIRNRHDEYDLDSESAIDLLVNDLVADSYGIDDSAEPLGVPALRFFREHFFDQRMGNRVWSIETEDIHEQVEMNPHIELVT